MRPFERLLQGKIPGPNTGIQVLKSVCTMCDPLTQCGLDCYVKDGRLIKVEGTAENPHNRGKLCSKGAATRQYVYNPDRLRTPLKRVGPRGAGEFVSVSWEEALDEVAAHLRRLKVEDGPESVVFYVGYPKQMRPFVQRMALQFGSPNYCTESSVCFEGMAMAWKLVFGQPALPDLENARCLLVWSNNPFYSNVPRARAFMEARDRGLKVIVVDPREAPITAFADLHLQLRPGTDGALALGMANVIIAEGLYDREFVDNYTRGFAEFRRYAAEFDLGRVEAETGVPADQVLQAARLYATTKPAALLPSSCVVVQHPNGVQNQRAAFTLVGLTGNFDVVGGNVPEPYSWLEIPGAGFASREHEFAMPRSWDELPQRVGAKRFPVWAELMNQAQAVDLSRHIRTGDPYPLRGLVAFGLNHRMFPDSNGMLQALERLDFICDVDLFLTDSARHADIVLPACTALERSEVRCYWEKYLLLTQPVIAPLAESRSDTDIVFDLARRLGLDDPLLAPRPADSEQAFDPAAVFEAAMDWIFEPTGMTMAQLSMHPGGMPVPDVRPNPERRYRRDGFHTPSGQMEFASSLLAEYQKEIGCEPLPVYKPPRDGGGKGAGAEADSPLVLSTGSRLPMFVHSRTFRLPWARSLRPHAAADINPVDAARLDIEQNDRVEIRTAAGAIQVEANVTTLVQPGVVEMFHDYPRADVNTLIEADHVDPISGFPGYKAVPCSLRRMETGSSSEAMDEPPLNASGFMIPTEEDMLKSRGVSFDLERCSGCCACVVACMDQNDFDPGVEASARRQVVTLAPGNGGPRGMRYMSISCLHCEDAPCLDACPSGAVYRHPTGAVLVDQGLCIACETCITVCPIQVPRVGKEDTIQKCDLCVLRLENGLEPACVRVCPTQALRWYPPGPVPTG